MPIFAPKGQHVQVFLVGGATERVCRTIDMLHSTPQKPPSDSESLQKFMVWKLIRIDFEVTLEVFQKCWCMIDALTVDHKSQKTSEVVLYLSERTSKQLGGFCGVEEVQVAVIA